MAVWIRRCNQQACRILSPLWKCQIGTDKDGQSGIVIRKNGPWWRTQRRLGREARSHVASDDEMEMSQKVSSTRCWLMVPAVQCQKTVFPVIVVQEPIDRTIHEHKRYVNSLNCSQTIRRILKQLRHSWIGRYDLR